MRKLDDRTLLSASDLMRFMGCAHVTTLDLAYMRGAGPTPRKDSEDAALLQKQGDTHEATHLARLSAAGHEVIEIKRGNLAANAETTRAALAARADVVFQGAFLSGNWGGWSDFLERVNKPSALGAFSYEVADTKLKRRPHPKHVLQLVLYSDLLTEIQGVAPEFAHVELGDGTRATLRLSDYAAYARMARERLEDFVANPQPTRPIPCADCGLCRWADHCDGVWAAEDSLFNVANITRSQVKKLEAAGIKTMEALATLDYSIRGMVENTRLRLVTQARLQHARKTGMPAFELRAPEPGKGFDLLPEPQPGDLFYDIEGDPHFEGGLEYLHGVWFDGQFRAFWGHDHTAESLALAELLEFFRARLAAYPDARIYHYAAYEVTALRRLTTKYGIGEAFLDRLLRERRFVDLFAVVRGGLIGSEPNYSIKSMEACYGRKREGEVKTAGGSVVAYERWRETGDQHILDEIEDYNRIDCISTEELRDWLVGIRPPAPWPSLGQDAGTKEAEEDAATQALRSALIASGLPQDRREMLFNLGLFHKREAKPAQWAVFDSVGKDEDDLIDDLDALAGLEAVGAAEPVKRSMARTYRFPQQETKLRGGRSATVPILDGPPATISIVDLDRTAREITLKTGAAKAHLLTDRLTLHPDWPLNTDVIAAALRDVIVDQCGPRTYHAVDDLLSRAAPRLADPTGSLLFGEGHNSAGSGGDGVSIGVISATPVAVFSPSNAALALSGSSAEAQQTNDALVNQHAVEMAGMGGNGGNGGNGNVVLGGDLGTHAGSGGNGVFYGALVSSDVAVFDPVNTAVRETESQLLQLAERMQAVDDQLSRTEIRAPQDGVITDLRIHTAGGVVGAGEPLLDLVPKEDRLIVTARIRPEDINVVHVGLPARVHLLPYDQRRVPLLSGTVAYVSADRLVDKQSGQSYYAATIRVSDEQLATMKDVTLVPGMPVQALIETGQSTVALYALRPVLDSFGRAFRED